MHALKCHLKSCYRNQQKMVLIIVLTSLKYSCKLQWFVSHKQNQSVNALFPQMINIELHKDEEKLKDFQALFINSSNLRLFLVLSTQVLQEAQL